MEVLLFLFLISALGGGEGSASRPGRLVHAERAHGIRLSVTDRNGVSYGRWRIGVVGMIKVAGNTCNHKIGRKLLM